MNDIKVTYRFPKGVNAEKQAQIIAIGQTAGTWSEEWDKLSSIFKQHMGRVASVTQNADFSFHAEVMFPRANFEGDIGGLLAIIFGKYSMAGAAKVVDIELPLDFGTPHKFGLDGIRKLTGVYNRPFVMAIFKQALGLSAAAYGSITRRAATAGLDIIKDDEIVGDIPSAPVFERLRECRKALDEHQARTGRNLLYAVNLSGSATTLIERARKLVKAGANAFMLNVFTYGFSVLEALAEDPTINVPIFTHPAFAGALCLSPDTGFSYPALIGKLLPKAGADAVLYPAHYGSLPFTREDERNIKDALQAANVLPIPSAGIKPELTQEILDFYGVDVALNSGTGIMDYTGGLEEGVKAFFDQLKTYRYRLKS